MGCDNCKEKMKVKNQLKRADNDVLTILAIVMLVLFLLGFKLGQYLFHTFS
jgi:hypothetical protein